MRGVLASLVLLAATLAGCGGPKGPQLRLVQLPHAQLRIPGSWVDGPSKGRHIIGGIPTETYVVLQTKVGDAGIAYASFAPPVTSTPSPKDLQRAMREALKAQRKLSDKELIKLRASAGLGCRSGPWRYVEKPHVVTQNGKGSAGSVLLRYGYTCNSTVGPIVGFSVTGYDYAGRKHMLTLTATGEYWQQHADVMPGTAASFRTR